MSSSRNVNVLHTPVRDNWLVAIVPPGGSIGLDDKLFSFWVLQRDSYTPKTSIVLRPASKSMSSKTFVQNLGVFSRARFSRSNIASSLALSYNPYDYSCSCSCSAPRLIPPEWCPTAMRLPLASLAVHH
ncbi:hypothetical protein DFH29DRAFT_1005345 [Suillus ampliporus]|nr:hypothetical protein DFH29DRAFT_1005345 [Suillus ampliporus]